MAANPIDFHFLLAVTKVFEKEKKEMKKISPRNWWAYIYRVPTPHRPDLVEYSGSEQSICLLLVLYAEEKTSERERERAAYFCCWWTDWKFIALAGCWIFNTTLHIRVIVLILLRYISYSFQFLLDYYTTTLSLSLSRLFWWMLAFHPLGGWCLFFYPPGLDRNPKC